ncbi:hypothetical protein ACFQZC_21835 [Streptacidiphilus monticola]
MAVPSMEVKWPTRNTRKSRYRSRRRSALTPRPGLAGRAARTTAAGSGGAASEQFREPRHLGVDVHPYPAEIRDPTAEHGIEADRAESSGGQLRLSETRPEAVQREQRLTARQSMA